MEEANNKSVLCSIPLKLSPGYLFVTSTVILLTALLRFESISVHRVAAASSELLYTSSASRYGSDSGCLTIDQNCGVWKTRDS
jgi:hypothetical protein